MHHQVHNPHPKLLQEDTQEIWVRVMCISARKWVHIPHLFSLNAIMKTTLTGGNTLENWAKDNMLNILSTLGAESAPCFSMPI